MHCCSSGITLHLIITFIRLKENVNKVLTQKKRTVCTLKCRKGVALHPLPNVALVIGKHQ